MEITSLILLCTQVRVGMFVVYLVGPIIVLHLVISREHTTRHHHTYLYVYCHFHCVFIHLLMIVNVEICILCSFGPSLFLLLEFE